MITQSQKSDAISVKNYYRPDSNFSAHGIFVINADGSIRYCNEVLLRWLGATPAQSRGKPITDFLPDFPLEIDAANLHAALAGTADEPKTLQLRPLSGGAASVQVTARPLLPDGKPSLVVIIERVGRIFTGGRRRDLAQLKASAEISGDAIAITDCSGRIEFVNTAFETMTGYNRDDLIGKTLIELQLGPPQIEYEQNVWKERPAGKIFSRVCTHRKKDGSHFHHEQSVRPFFDEEGAITHAVFTGRDVSESVDEMQRLTYQTNYDNLTGLPNRNLISDRLQQTLKRAARHHQGFTLARLDVDQLKAIKDHFGEVVGDAILREIALRMQNCVRAEDTVGRFSSDEFTLILHDVEQRADVETVIDKINVTCAEALPVKGQMLHLSVSVGTAIYPIDGDDEQSLLEYAGAAKYRAKEKANMRA